MKLKARVRVIKSMVDWSEERVKGLDRRMLGHSLNIHGNIQRFAPVDTGNLKGSYRVIKIDTGHYMIGTDVDYAPHQEFGTIFQDGTPHARPSLEIERRKIERSVRVEMRLAN